MSLKAIHMLFVGLATLIILGFAIWSGQQALHGGGVSYLLMAALGVLVAPALPAYAAWFLKKTREVSFL